VVVVKTFSLPGLTIFFHCELTKVDRELGDTLPAVVDVVLVAVVVTVATGSISFCAADVGVVGAGGAGASSTCSISSCGGGGGGGGDSTAARSHSSGGGGGGSKDSELGMGTVSKVTEELDDAEVLADGMAAVAACSTASKASMPPAAIAAASRLFQVLTFGEGP